MDSHFILSKSKLLEQIKILENLELKISYSYKTNHEVGDLLQELSPVHFSIHAKDEIKEIKDNFHIEGLFETDKYQLLGLPFYNEVLKKQEFQKWH